MSETTAELLRKALLIRHLEQAFRGELYVQDGKWWTGERQLSLGDVVYLIKVGRIERVYFLAGNCAQMQFYLRELEIDPKRAIHLRESRQLRGLHQPTVIVCGTANERRDYVEVLDWLRRRDAAVYWHNRPDWGYKDIDWLLE